MRAPNVEARMKRLGFLFPLILLPLCTFLPEAQGNTEKTQLRGWLSDEGCAGGRASGGLYTGTNPDCAKRCVREGKKIVLVDPEHKRLLTIENPDAAVARVGDYVEISGDLNERAKTLRIDSLKLLEKGRAMCDVPKKKS